MVISEVKVRYLHAILYVSYGRCDLIRQYALLGNIRHVTTKYIWHHKNSSSIMFDVAVNIWCYFFYEKLPVTLSIRWFTEYRFSAVFLFWDTLTLLQKTNQHMTYDIAYETYFLGVKLRSSFDKGFIYRNLISKVRITATGWPIYQWFCKIMTCCFQGLFFKFICSL